MNSTIDWYNNYINASGIIVKLVDFEEVLNDPTNTDANALAQFRQGQGSGPFLKTVGLGCLLMQ